ncbi:hypothetical protein ACFLUZ_01100 [Chloroflexota bacterium]
MVECELCGRLFKTPQGLRGHKTFFHGHRARRNEPVEFRENSLNKSDEKLNRLTKDIQIITETLADLKRNLNYLQYRMVSLASRSEIHRIASEVNRLNSQVEKHNRWFNPHGLHEAVLDLDGGPITDLEKRLRGRSFTKSSK